MIHLSSYHSNGLPPVVWSNKVNLIGEKVYKPKIHFCEHCNKPILIYGRLIPCKHVFCFTCATLCLNNNNLLSTTLASSPALPGQTNEPQLLNHSPLNNNTINNNNNSNSNSSWNNNNNHSSSNSNNDKHNHRRHSRNSNNNNNNHFHLHHNNNSKNLELQQTDANHPLLPKDNNNSNLMNIDDSTSNTTPTTFQQDVTNSPNINGGFNGTGIAQPQQPSSLSSSSTRGCHRCGGRALRVERNTLNSIFVCQVDTCKRTYLSARDLQAHVTHRHSRNKSAAGNSSGSMAAISSSPYISSSSLLHLNNSHNQNTNSNNHRQSSTSNSTSNHNTSNSPNNHHNHRARDRDPHHHHGGNGGGGGGNRERDRERERSRADRERDSHRHRDRDSDRYRDSYRDRDSKEHHRQSLQRAAQWAEASAQMLEKGLTR